MASNTAWATENHDDLFCGDVITGSVTHGQSQARFYSCTGQTQWNGRAHIYHLPHVGGSFSAVLEWLDNPNGYCDDLSLFLVQECDDDGCDHDGEDDGDDDDDYGHDGDGHRNGNGDDNDERDFCCIAADAHFLTGIELCGDCGESCHHDDHGDGDEDGDQDDHGWHRDGWDNGCGHGDNDRTDGGHDEDDNCPDYWLIVDSRCNTSTAYTLTIYCCDTELGVELASFGGSSTSNGVALNWSTASETNNDRFEISRVIGSSESDWSQIGVVDGQGTTASASHYSFVDQNVTDGEYNYALTSVDMDGNRHTLGQVAVEYSPATAPVASTFELLGNYPNPFNPTTQIRFQLAEAGQVTLSVLDVQGRLIATLVDGMVEAGVHEQSFDATGFASGVYFTRLTNGNKSDVMKRVLMK
ncbi:MAG: T9SS type A sorting domain-containing protein [bacterium]|nr:T9SS type A sorting domain-containing protein [bacterium]